MRNGYGHRVLDQLIARVRASHADRAERLAALRTRDDALAYQERRARGHRSRLPAAPRAPAAMALDAEITGAWSAPAPAEAGCRAQGPLREPPGPVGHGQPLHPARPARPRARGAGHLRPLARTARPSRSTRPFASGWRAAGSWCLIYDPLNQGERDQYAPGSEREVVRGCTSAHNMMGKQLELLGENLATWRAWDGMRALDYLLSRPEVDPRRVGVTGNSGGGTMSTWLWAIEPRLTMAAPSCFVTTFLHNLENELPADAEQYPPGVLGAGLEMADFLIARAPQPALLLGQRYDFFDRRGFYEARGEIARFYGLLGAPAQDDASYRSAGLPARFPARLCLVHGPALARLPRGKPGGHGALFRAARGAGPP